MFCYIKYAEWEEVKSDDSARPSYATLKSPSNKTNLRENKTLLVNPNCYMRILIDYVAEKLNFDFNNAALDMCNESGELLKVYDIQPCEYATNILLFQRTYVVVKCFRTDDGGLRGVEPLLYKNSKEYFDVMPRLKKYIPTSRRSLDRQRSKKSVDDLTTSASRDRRRSLDDGSRISARNSRRTMVSSSNSRNPLPRPKSSIHSARL